jgi:predicted nucleic acid-binding protein
MRMRLAMNARRGAWAWGHPGAAGSVVSIAELYVGVREGVERQRLDAFVSAFEVLPLEKETAMQAGLLRRQYGRSHFTMLANVLVPYG